MLSCVYILKIIIINIRKVNEIKITLLAELLLRLWKKYLTQGRIFKEHSNMLRYQENLKKSLIYFYFNETCLQNGTGF